MFEANKAGWVMSMKNAMDSILWSWLWKMLHVGCEKNATKSLTLFPFVCWTPLLMTSKPSLLSRPKREANWGWKHDWFSDFDPKRPSLSCIFIYLSLLILVSCTSRIWVSVKIIFLFWLLENTFFFPIK